MLIFYRKYTGRVQTPSPPAAGREPRDRERVDLRVEQHVDLGFGRIVRRVGRIVVSEIEAPNLFVNLI